MREAPTEGLANPGKAPCEDVLPRKSLSKSLTVVILLAIIGLGAPPPPPKIAAPAKARELLLEFRLPRLKPPWVAVYYCGLI